MSNPDADLRLLGVRLFEAEAEAVRADAAFDEIHNQILENVETVATDSTFLSFSRRSPTKESANDCQST